MPVSQYKHWNKESPCWSSVQCPWLSFCWSTISFLGNKNFQSIWIPRLWHRSQLLIIHTKHTQSAWDIRATGSSRAQERTKEETVEGMFESWSPLVIPQVWLNSGAPGSGTHQPWHIVMWVLQHAFISISTNRLLECEASFFTLLSFPYVLMSVCFLDQHFRGLNYPLVVLMIIFR